MANYVGADVNVWTDILVPPLSALIGGGLAILGGWFGARWAARYQNEQAERIAHKIRRDEREEDALIEIDAVLSKLETELSNLLGGAEVSPGQLVSNLTDHVGQHLYTFNREWNRLALTIRDVGAGHVLSTFSATGLVDELAEIQERRRASNDATEALEWVRSTHEQVQEIRKLISETVAHLVHRQDEGFSR